MESRASPKREEVQGLGLAMWVEDWVRDRCVLVSVGVGFAMWKSGWKRGLGLVSGHEVVMSSSRWVKGRFGLIGRGRVRVDYLAVREARLPRRANYCEAKMLRNAGPPRRKDVCAQERVPARRRGQEQS